MQPGNYFQLQVGGESVRQPTILYCSPLFRKVLCDAIFAHSSVRDCSPVFTTTRVAMMGELMGESALADDREDEYGKVIRLTFCAVHGEP